MKKRILVLLVLICVTRCSYNGTFFHHGGFNYLVSTTEGQTWEQAKTTCESKNGTLAVLNTRKNLDSLIPNLPKRDKYWVGLKFCDEKYRWVNKEVLNTNLHAQKQSPNHKCYTVRFKTEANDRDFEKGQCNHTGTKHKFICGIPYHSSGASTITTSKASPTFGLSGTPTMSLAIYSGPLPGVQETQTLNRIGLSFSIDNVKSSSSMQKSAPSSCSSSSSLIAVVSTSSVINPTKTSSVYLSKTVTTKAPSNSPQPELDMIKRFREVMKNSNTSEPDCMTVLLDKYDGLMNWMDEQEGVEYNPLTDAQSIEDIALEFAKLHLASRKTSLNISNKHIDVHAKLLEPDTDFNVVFPEASEDSHVNTITMPKSLFQGQETYVVNVVFKNNKTIRRLTPSVMEGEVDEKEWLVSTEIFSISIFPKKDEPFEDVIITLNHLQKKQHYKPHCGFWNFSIPTPYNGSWSQRGCRVVSSTDKHTVCACNHLTNFAILMQLSPDEPMVHQKALSVITYIGLALSLLGEVITVLLYCVFLNLRHEKIQIRVNLLCALGAAQIVFLAGIDKTENKDVCTFVAAMIHMLYLASFCWMLMEGVYLYRMVVKVFDAHITMRYSYLFACGFPLSVVAVSLVVAAFQAEGVHSYINKRYCWIRFDNGFIWLFVGPVLLLIAINTFFLFSVLKEMAAMKSVKAINSFELSSLKASARACVLLLPLLGITWVFGLLSLTTTGVVWQYIFTILNTTQGFMIFVLHCLRNTELRAAIELRYFQWESNHSSNNSHSRVTPSRDGKFLTIEDSDKGRSDSIPMAAKANKVSPK